MSEQEKTNELPESLQEFLSLGKEWEDGFTYTPISRMEKVVSEIVTSVCRAKEKIVLRVIEEDMQEPGFVMSKRGYHFRGKGIGLDEEEVFYSGGKPTFCVKVERDSGVTGESIVVKTGKAVGCPEKYGELE